MSFPEAEERDNGFDQSQDEVDVAQGDEAPDPPLEDDPEHQEDAAAQRNLTGPWMLLEEHQRGQQLGQSVHGQEGESGRDEILEQEVRPGHLGAQEVQHRRTSPARTGRVHPHHHGSPHRANGDEKGQYLQERLHGH